MEVGDEHVLHVERVAKMFGVELVDGRCGIVDGEVRRYFSVYGHTGRDRALEDLRLAYVERSMVEMTRRGVGYDDGIESAESKLKTAKLKWMNVMGIGEYIPTAEMIGHGDYVITTWSVRDREKILKILDGKSEREVMGGGRLTKSESRGKELKGLLEDCKGVEDGGGGFRVQNSRFHLTYPSHMNERELLEELKKVRPVKKYSIVNETSDDGHEHCHALIWFSKILRAVNCRILDVEGFHPNIKLVTTSVHWENILKYHRKQNAPFTSEDDRGIVERVQECGSLNEAIQNNVNNLREVSGVMTLFSMKENEFGEEPDVSWTEWQKELYEEIVHGRPHDREILWYWDEQGGGGKSFMANHMYMYHNAFITTSTSARDIATVLDKTISSKGPKGIKIAVFNLSRASNVKEVYTALEQMKDGFMCSEKYIGRAMKFEVPHVVVFANTLPCVYKLSLDRWNIRIVSPLGDRIIYTLKGNYFSDVKEGDYNAVISKYEEIKSWYHKVASEIIRCEKPPKQLNKVNALSGGSYSLPPSGDIVRGRSRSISNGRDSPVPCASYTRTTSDFI